jgi:hypothetical protein
MRLVWVGVALVVLVVCWVVLAWFLTPDEDDEPEEFGWPFGDDPSSE